MFVRGLPNFVVYSSPKTHKMETGVNLFVREVELCGGHQEQEQNNANTTQAPAGTATNPAGKKDDLPF